MAIYKSHLLDFFYIGTDLNTYQTIAKTKCFLTNIYYTIRNYYACQSGTTRKHPVINLGNTFRDHQCCDRLSVAK